jgi:hypothetical protein
MTGMHGRHVIARDFRCVQELPFHQDGGQTRRRDCGSRAFGQSLCLPWLPQSGGDSQRQKNSSCANLADWLSSGLSGSRGAALPMQSVPVPCVSHFCLTVFPDEFLNGVGLRPEDSMGSVPIIVSASFTWKGVRVLDAGQSSVRSGRWGAKLDFGNQRETTTVDCWRWSWFARSG